MTNQPQYLVFKAYELFWLGITQHFDEAELKEYLLEKGADERKFYQLFADLPPVKEINIGKGMVVKYKPQFVSP